MLGYLAVTDNKPMKPDPGRELILKVFAARAGAELERTQSETALMVAKEAAEAANRAKSTFLANMSHELRTPLNSILGFTQLMVRDTSLATQQRNFLETINRSGEHLLTLINDVLEMSKIEAGRTVLNPESFDLHLLLHTVYEMFQGRADNKYLALEFDQSADLPQHVVADEGKLRQILINLLSNAIKFTQAGRVSLSASVLSRHGNVDAVHRQPTDSQWILYFEVEDTGIGIPADELENLFQPFVQTSSGNQTREGTGLGLAISRQFVQLMGGSISVTSTLGQGSVFSFDVPVLLVDPEAVPAPVAYKQVIGLAPHQPIYRILVVDDRPENRDLVTQMLLKVGFEVRTANNGQEAISQWQAWHPHLIWMDMRMPVMDGYEATRRIRDVESRVLLCVKDSTKIIALTASAFDEQQSTILAAGCDDLVIKPFREAVLFEKMATHLGVEYVYAAEPSMEGGDEPSAEPPTTVPGFVLRPESFDPMPPDWVKQLHQAALAVDSDQILQLVEQIPAGDRTLAEALTHLVQQYNFDEILELTQGMN
jgi:two-component system sensor histidine kinase/response regulator